MSTESECPRCARGRVCLECDHRDVYNKLSSLPREMSEEVDLLTDEQVQTFIRDGVLLLPPELPEWFHAHIHRRCSELGMDKPGFNPGNNFLAQMPELEHLLMGKRVRGALQSLLGEGYVMDGHRYCHPSGPGRVSQQWHKDATASGYTRRLLKIGRAMLMYYPTEVLLEHGPTGVIEGSQYCSIHDHIEMLTGSAAATEVCDDGRTMPDPPSVWGSQRAMTTPGPGWCALIHFDLWHRGMGNTTSDFTRFMLKFQFYRVEPPRKPSWRHVSPEWCLKPSSSMRPPLLPVWLAVWRWMLGAEDQLDVGSIEDGIAGAGDGDAAPHAPADLHTALHMTHARVPCRANHECVSLSPDDNGTTDPIPDTEVAGVLAAFALARDASGRTLLAQDMRSAGPDVGGRAAARRAADAFALLPPRSVDAELVGVVLDTLRSAPTPIGRMHAAYVVGEWCTQPSDATRAALLAAERDVCSRLDPSVEPDGRVREAIVSALGIFATLPGASTDELRDAVLTMLESEPLLPAQPAIALALHHIQRVAGLDSVTLSRCAAQLGARKDRYAGSLLLEALRREAVKSSPELRPFIECLMWQRWCPLTDTRSAY